MRVYESLLGSSSALLLKRPAVYSLVLRHLDSSHEQENTFHAFLLAHLSNKKLMEDSLLLLTATVSL